MEKILIAPCGMNCAICSAYLARKYDLKKQGIRRSYCEGCRPRGKNCAFMKRSCERLGDGLVRYCYECAEYPCQRLKRLDKRYRLNYHMSMIENLNFIKENGEAEFLRKEVERWQCPECGGTISCHGGLCFKCGVERLKSKKGRYTWDSAQKKPNT
jgi:hypothetical protein